MEGKHVNVLSISLCNELQNGETATGEIICFEFNLVALFVFFAKFVSPDQCCSYTVGDSTMLVVTGGQIGGAGSWNVATSSEVKYC